MIWSLVLRFSIADIKYARFSSPGSLLLHPLRRKASPVSSFLIPFPPTARKVLTPKKVFSSGVNGERLPTTKLTSKISRGLGRTDWLCSSFSFFSPVSNREIDENTPQTAALSSIATAPTFLTITLSRRTRVMRVRRATSQGRSGSRRSTWESRFVSSCSFFFLLQVLTAQYCSNFSMSRTYAARRGPTTGVS
jgi:hypothetical protein